MLKQSKLTILSALLASAASVVTAGPAMADDPADAGLFDFSHVSCGDGQNQVRVVIEGLKKSVGLIAVDLYRNDEDGFLKKAGRVDKVRVAARAPETKLCVTAPGPGEYAIAAYHDRNANLKFDKTPIGMPSEPWGISNDPKVRFAPPHVDEALFPVAPTGANVVIKLH